MTKTRKPKSSKARNDGLARSELVVVSTGCPAGIGPEVALKAALKPAAGRVVLVGDRGSLEAAATASGIDAGRIRRLPAYGVSSQARVSFIEAGYDLAHRLSVPLATGPVSKECIAKSGLLRARSFRGHTEWLEALDGAPYTVMCFSSPVLTTSLVTTHLPLAKVSKVLGPELVSRAIVELSDLLLRQGVPRPKVAVCSFNPHAGEGELLGTEERRAVLPGVERAARLLGRRVQVTGPLGAETAFRLGAKGSFDGVVGIYHDQVTIPMKLLDFGGSVNVTQGLRIVRTSVDHGTAYDIAGKGLADAGAMSAAIRLARQLSAVPRRFAQGAH